MWYAIFFSGEGVAIKVLVEKGKNITGKYNKDISTGEAEKYQTLRPVTGSKHFRLLHGIGPSHAFEIVTVFLKKEKVSVLPHLPYSQDLAPCDFFMFSKLK